MKALFSNWTTWKKVPWTLVTKHQKEEAIFPILKTWEVEEMQVIPAETDSLGTFSGEILRALSVEKTLLAKCHLGFHQSNHRIFVATEGSFGPHPQFPWLAEHQESFLLMDRFTNQQHYFHFNSRLTNFQLEEIKTYQSLVEFCHRVKFPSHSIIIKGKTIRNESKIVKGIKKWDDVWAAFQNFPQGCIAETDMRAMNNPTRMSQIRLGFSQFLQLLSLECPHCRYPGFYEKKFEAGLPCLWCQTPTTSILHAIRSCSHCHHEETIKFPQGKSHEDPMYCLNCNP